LQYKITALNGYIEELKMEIPIQRASVSSQAGFGCRIDWTARSAEYCSAMLVNVINECMGDHRRFQAARGIKTLITAPEPQHLGDSVGMMEFKEQRADHVVHAWA